MAETREQLVYDLRGSYSIYYDIYNNNGDTDLPLAFRADFHNRDESYMLIKAAKVWGNEQNEYVFVFSSSSFDKELVEKCIEYAKNTALPMITPHKEHNYSNIHTIFIADSIDYKTRKVITSQKYSKSYNHSLHGFTLLKSLYIDMASGQYSSNNQGHDLNKVVNKLFPNLKAVNRKWF